MTQATIPHAVPRLYSKPNGAMAPLIAKFVLDRRWRNRYKGRSIRVAVSPRAL